MTKLEWKQVFRPFLEQEASRTRPLWPLLRDAVRAALATRRQRDWNADPTPSDIPMNEVNDNCSLVEAMARDRPRLDEETADRVLARALKVLCHVLGDHQCAAAFFGCGATSCSDRAPSDRGESADMEVDDAHGAVPLQSSARDEEDILSVGEVIEAALWCSSDASPLSGEMRDPCIRTEGLHMLSVMCRWPPTYEEALKRDKSHGGIENMLSLALSCLSDPNFRISEEAVTLLSLLILGPTDAKEEITEEWESVIMGGELGRKLQEFSSGMAPVRVSVAVVNVVNLLLCCEPKERGRGLMFVEKYRLAEMLLPLLLSTDRLLRFRIVEMVEDIASANLHYLCFPDSTDSDHESAMVAGIAGLLHLEQTAEGDAPSHLLSLGAEISGVLTTRTPKASTAVVRLLFEPVLDFVTRILFETDNGREGLAPRATLPPHCASMAVVGICTRVIEAGERLMRKEKLFVGEEGPTRRSAFSRFVCGVLSHPLFYSAATLCRSALAALGCLFERDIVGELTVVNILLQVSSTRDRPVAVMSSALQLLAKVLLKANFCSLGKGLLTNVRETVQLLLYHPSPQQRESVLQFLLSLLSCQALSEEIIGDSVVRGAMRAMMGDDDDFLRTRAVSGLSYLAAFAWTREWWCNADMDEDDMVTTVLNAMQDDADSVRRASLEVLKAWIDTKGMSSHLLEALSCQHHLHALQKGISSAAADIDWEVKRRLIQLLGHICQKVPLDSEEEWPRSLPRKIISSTDSLSLFIALAEDYDRVARQDALLELSRVKGLWLAHGLEHFEEIPGAGVFLRRLMEMDCDALARECSLEAVYPDETDMRTAASEIENPPDCY